MDVSQRNSFKWLVWPKRQINAKLYKQLPFGNDLKKIQRHAFGIYFTPQIQEDWFCDTCVTMYKPLLSMLIDQITLHFFVAISH